MFAEGTEWKMPWLPRILPNILGGPSGKDYLYPLHPGPAASWSGRWHVAALL